MKRDWELVDTPIHLATEERGVVGVIHDERWCVQETVMRKCAQNCVCEKAREACGGDETVWLTGDGKHAPGKRRTNITSLKTKNCNRGELKWGYV